MAMFSRYSAEQFSKGIQVFLFSIRNLEANIKIEKKELSVWK